jgi:hypothetical protein
MPLQEQYVYISNALYEKITTLNKDLNVFPMPSYLDYLTITKKIGFDEALIWSLVIAKKMVTTKYAENTIIIGNVEKVGKIDSIFNFQYPEKDAEYKDVFIEKLTEIANNKLDKTNKNDLKLLSCLNNLYTAKDSIMPLHNTSASAKFLTEYALTDPNLNALKAKYKGKMNFEEVAEYVRNH